MASLYKNHGFWYVSTYVNGKRLTKSLQTKERKIAYAFYQVLLMNQLILIMIYHLKS